MTQVNLYEATTNLSELLERAARGEDIVIANAGQPRVRLVPVREGVPERRPGRARGRIHISPDFEDPLPDLAAAAFGPLPDRDPPR